MEGWLDISYHVTLGRETNLTASDRDLYREKFQPLFMHLKDDILIQKAGVVIVSNPAGLYAKANTYELQTEMQSIIDNWLENIVILPE